MSLGNFLTGLIVGFFILSLYTNLTNLDDDIMDIWVYNLFYILILLFNHILYEWDGGYMINLIIGFLSLFNSIVFFACGYGAKENDEKEVKVICYMLSMIAMTIFANIFR